MKWSEAGTGDAVIFIHGFPFNRTMWDGQLNAVPDGWRFIAPDLTGFGESADSGTDPLMMERFSDDIVQLMKQLDVDQAVIVGLSMGGYVALDLVTRYPDRVRALVLTATRANADSDEARKKRFELAAKSRAHGTIPVIETMLPHLLSAHSRLKMPALVKQVHAMMESTSPQTLSRALLGMAQRKDYTAELAGINVSTLVVRGDSDDIIPATEMDGIARGVRGARQEVITLTGHLPPLENTEVFNSILVRFLELLPPALSLGDFSLSF